MRVVSLVPSLTELVWALRPEALAGRTRFCTVPPAVMAVPAIGGTKNPDIQRIVRLAPDLVIANKEENRREDVEELRAAGLTVLLTDPNTVDEALEMILAIGGLLDAGTLAQGMVEEARAALAEPQAPARRVLVPIWDQPFMALGSATYGHDLLERCGAVNVLRGRQRYPQLSRDEAQALEPEVVLLPDEPYRFGLKHLREYESLGKEVLRVPGEWLWWYGPRIASSVRSLKLLLSGKSPHRIIVAGPAAFDVTACDVLIGLAKEFESPVIGLPTGKTPIGLYEELGRRVRAGDLDVSRWRPFAIDEYAADPAHPGSNRSFFARYWDTIPGAMPVAQFDAGAPDLEAEAGRFAGRLAEAGGLDIALLGIGMNGHLAFNEPGSTAGSPTRLVDLAPESRDAASEAWGGEPPARGLTLGMRELRAARTVVVLANGSHKAAIVKRALEGPAVTGCPASLLRGHPELSWVLDEPAARHPSLGLR